MKILLKQNVTVCGVSNEYMDSTVFSHQEMNIDRNILL